MLLPFLHIVASTVLSLPDSVPNQVPVDPCRDVVQYYCEKEGVHKHYVYDKQIYEFRCDTLPQVLFWQQIMNLDKDSGLINISHNRQVIQKVNCIEWNRLPENTKLNYRMCVKEEMGLSDSSRIFMTEGKKYFYDFDKVYYKLHRGIEDFIANDVDPWYAQAILLIESPNRLQKSNVGAYGPFQLMKGVAKMYGLKINKHIDERADFDRSAYAASSLLKYICIPKTKEMLNQLNIPFHEQDLWFRLLVMHVYHAGIGNVKAAMFAMMPEKGGMEMIQKLWQTQARGFKIASQNYSQLVLAAMLEMNKRIPLQQVASAK